MIATPADGWLRGLGLVLATFVSEDATCIATGLWIRAGQVSVGFGVIACTLGIFLGDLCLWLLGRVFGRRVLGWRWVRRRLPERQVEQFAAWFDQRGWKAVVASRFLPGTRLPVFVASGILGRRAGRFALWALIAALIWTPALVLAVAALGPVVVKPMERFMGGGWLPVLATIGVLWLVVRGLLTAATEEGRARLASRIARLWRWEFWPAWLFYAPLAPWIGWLAWRHRGLMTPTAANPGIVPHGGIVGESKYDILSKLPREWVAASELIPPGPMEERAARLHDWMAWQGLQFPIILKPDAGQRGAGVRRVRDAESAARYLAENATAVVAQAYHPGPYEAGIFYYRMPGEPRGRIFSITDKQFPVLVGDGVSTTRSLIWRHPRYRMQADTFLARMNGQADAVLARDERLPLAMAGNHCQGTLLRDGAHLLTPELERAVDAIALQFEGFYFGRFDVRYTDVDAFNAGRGFAIIELNGVTSESTNLYDPNRSLLWAYRVLFRQWRLLYAIGAGNRRRGHASSTLVEVIADARAYYRNPPLSSLSD